MKQADKKTPNIPKFLHSHWYTLGAGFLLALIALIIADWPNSTRFLSSKLCLSSTNDRNIFQMIANERAKYILKYRYYARRSREAGDVEISLSRNYTDCLYEEALTEANERRDQDLVSRSSLSRDLRAAIEKIPFSKEEMVLKLECDRKKGFATATLHMKDGDKAAPLELHSRKLNEDQTSLRNSVLAAGSGPIHTRCL